MALHTVAFHTAVCQLHSSPPPIQSSLPAISSSQFPLSPPAYSCQFHEVVPISLGCRCLGKTSKTSVRVGSISRAGLGSQSCSLARKPSRISLPTEKNWSPSRLQASQDTEVNVETEAVVENQESDGGLSVGEEVTAATDAVVGNQENDGGLSVGEEATAAVTVAAIASDADAIPSILDTIETEKPSVKDISADESGSFIGPELAAIYAKCQQWQWKDKYLINYVVQGSGAPVVLVHGFGASIGHFRKNIGVLSESNTVYALDLLGLGASEKPVKFPYTMETWAELVVDFLKEVVGSPAVLVGNSIGGLTCLMATAEAPTDLVRGLVLLNCAGGMNNKATTDDDWRLKLATPLLWLIDYLLNQPSIASGLFNRVRSRSNIMNVMQSVYGNKASVDDELVEVILRPADTPGALDAFVAIVTGPPGPKPQKVMERVSTSLPVLLLWGDKDPFTPIDGPVGKFFANLASTSSNVQLRLLPGVGHCPHDDRPELVHESLVPWLASLPTS